MKYFKKITVAALLTMFVVSGCTKAADNAEKTASPPTTEQGATPETVKANMFGWVKPSKPLVIDYYQADQGDDKKDQKNRTLMHQYVLDEFNVDLKKKLYDVNPEEKLNLMLVSGDYTPVIAAMDNDNITKWASQNKLVDLAPLVDKVAPGIKTELGARYTSYLDKDGHLWGLPRGWGFNKVPDVSAHIRWDWYQEMGAPKIDTPDDYYHVLKQMVAAHPVNAKGEKVYAISWNDGVKIEQILGFWGLKEGYKEGSDHSLTNWVNTAEGLEAIKYYNRFFREGLMDPEAFLNKYEDWQTKFSNERIVGHIGPWWQSWNAGHEIWSKEPNYKEDKRYVQISFKAPGAEKAYINPKNTIGWNYTVITDKAKDPEEILKLLEFSMTPMGTRLFGWGVPNLPDSLWNFDGSKWDFNTKPKQAFIDGKPNYPLNETLGGTVYSLASPIGLLRDDNKSMFYYNQNFNDETKWTKLLQDNMKDTVYDSTDRRITFTPENPLTIKNQQIEDAIKVGMVKAITSKTEADCIANFYALRDNLNKLGLKDIEKFRTDEYKKNLALMK
ncbi:sugar ABC transporter substrate-binding protein [Paenibacillus sp. UMB7766-LJ446]|nr:sugar ABC transporter substrate-binding protein [Paenibacillus sp. UMB7766-LJ446]